MSNYLPHYTKRKQRLARKEEKLRRAISTEAKDFEELKRLVEDVRIAQCSVLKDELSRIDVENPKHEMLEAQLLLIAAKPRQDILAEYASDLTLPDDW